MIGILNGCKIVTIDYMFEKSSNIPKRRSKKREHKRNLLRNTDMPIRLTIDLF